MIRGLLRVLVSITPETSVLPDEVVLVVVVVVIVVVTLETTVVYDVADVFV